MKKGHVVIAIIAVLLFAWVMAHISLSTMVEQLKAVRIALPIVLALSALRLYLQSLTWSASLKGQDVSIGPAKLAAVRLAAQSMGYLTVLGPVISEPMKIKLLGTPAEPTVTGTFLDDGVYWFTSMLIAISGLLSLPLLTAHGARYHSIPAILVLALAIFIITRRNSILSGAVRAFRERVPSWLIHAEKAEASIRNFRLERPALVSRMFWFDVACQLLIASEVFVVLWALHLPIHFLAVLAIEGMTRTVKMMSGWIPARLGSDEGGAISAFAVAGFSPFLGLALALTRRVRDLLWALIGIVWLAWNSRAVSDEPENTASLPALVKEVL
ncbi:MAG TPA: lysylphosphatidylglycerol synthase domain-containing protein [Terriglobales bacterium]|nr:lysylphosphatidylglycerol synthase domain-containing protein [Terriglobales bacterium]